MIQWFPGHMAKAIKEIEEKIKFVDIIFTLSDARVPLASKNPLFNELFKNKLVLNILTKTDKADPIQTNKWLQYFSKEWAIGINAHNKKDIQKLKQTAETMMIPKRQKDALKGIKPRPIKIMIVGIPNVGKSTLINALVGKKSTVIGDKPGVTKFQQWIKINENLELLDTPGVLWPKFEDQNLALNLAITGAIKDDLLKLDQIAEHAINIFVEFYPDEFTKRYQLTSFDHCLEQIASKYSYYTVNKTLDIDKAATTLLQDYRHDLICPITLDRCPINEITND